MRKPPLSACSIMRLLPLVLVAAVALVAPEAGASHSLPATSAEKRRGLEGQLSHHKRNLHHAVTAMPWCVKHRALFKGTAGHDCYWPHYRLSRSARTKIRQVQRRLWALPPPYPGTTQMPRYLGVATLKVFGHARYAQAQCIAYYENKYAWTVSATGDWSPWQINYVSWSGTFDFSRLNGPEDALYAATAAYRISRGGTNWMPWVVYWKWGVCH